jgi:transcriptional regulator with XRE-family HTH domain
MNNIQELQKYILRHHPDAVINIDTPVQDTGVWSLDIDLADRHLVVEWSAATGFGISSRSFETFGETADEHIRSLSDAQRRVEELLTTDAQTAPPLPLFLSRLRERCGITQRDLAEKLGVRQATISGIERREDIQVSTLRRFVEGLGGRLEIYGLFPNAEYCIATTRSYVASHPTSARQEHCRTIRWSGLGEGAFESLRQAGTLSHANSLAKTISLRHAVIEMP